MTIRDLARRPQGASPETTSSDATEHGGTVQRRALRGLDLDAQQALLAPPSPVQARGGEVAGDVHAAAAHGTSGSGSALPHLDAIQTSFGHHDVTSVQAHVGGRAAEAADAMGASAYATGNDAAFASAPDLHTAAHEAAHNVQQRAGVSLAGGVGSSGDAYEQHADHVADAVVAGRSAAPVLDEMTGGGGGGGAVQRAEVVQRLDKPPLVKEKTKLDLKMRPTDDDKVGDDVSKDDKKDVEPVDTAPAKRFVYNGEYYEAKTPDEEAQVVQSLTGMVLGMLFSRSSQTQASQAQFDAYVARYTDDGWLSEVIQFFRGKPPEIEDHPAFEVASQTNQELLEYVMGAAPTTFAELNELLSTVIEGVKLLDKYQQDGEEHLAEFGDEKKGTPTWAGLTALLTLGTIVGGVAASGAAGLAAMAGITAKSMFGLLGVIKGTAGAAAAVSTVHVANKAIDGENVVLKEMLEQAIVQGGANGLAGFMLATVSEIRTNLGLTDPAKIQEAFEIYFLQKGGQRTIRDFIAECYKAHTGTGSSGRAFAKSLFHKICVGGLLAAATAVGGVPGAIGAGTVLTGAATVFDGEETDVTLNKQQQAMADKERKKKGYGNPFVPEHLR